MPAEEHVRRSVDLRFLASVSLRFNAPRSVGETPDGVRFDFMLEGTVDGPELRGRFPQCAAYLLIDPDGIGTIVVRAPLLFNDGAIAELEATGRYDFGQDGYQRAIAADLPNSALGWCPRFLTGDPRYLWLNRVLCLGVGELRPRESSVAYDLFAMAPGAPHAPASLAPASSAGWGPAPRQSAAALPYGEALPRPGDAPSLYAASLPRPGGVSTSSLGEARPSVERGEATLYERLGGQPVVAAIASDFVDALVDNVRLNRQNPIVAMKHAAARGEGRAHTARVAGQLFCKLTGGPCEFELSRPMKETHANLAISESDWSIMREALDRVLSKHRIRRRERDDLFAIIEATKPDVVTRG